MPQFDQTTFLNQVIWFIFIFFTFYFLISYFFLPVISKNIKFRKKKIFYNLKNKNLFIFEKINKQHIFSNYFIKYINITENFINIIYKKNIFNNNIIKKELFINNKYNKNILSFINNYIFYIKNI